MTTTFITGANRGIGLEFTRQLLQRSDFVFASCRLPKKAEELHKLKATYPESLRILELDVLVDTQIESAAKAVQTETDSLDLLINNAGINPSGEQFSNLNSDTMINTLHTNSIAPTLVARAFTDLLTKGNAPKIINISSGMGSITRSGSGGYFSYRASKAALNMFSKVLAGELGQKKIIVVSMHPGWVRTDMGGSGASLPPEKSVASTLEVIDHLTLSDSGRFLRWDGVELPW